MATDKKTLEIKDAQYRKGLSIAFFNATNAAIELLKVKFEATTDPEIIQQSISFWRDWFISEHANYYSEVIAPIGLNYNPVEVIDKLKQAKNIDELALIWRRLSEDVRQDATVIKAKNELKHAYENQ